MSLQANVSPSPTRTSDWLVPAALIALAVIPIAGGIVRLVSLSSGAVTPANIRFFASPIPAVLHIFSVAIYCVVGAFQFSRGFRRRHMVWHRRAGRVLIGLGLVAALSGLWMANFYAIVPPDNWLLHGFRLFFGSAMAASIVIGYLAIRQRKVGQHEAWMLRAYAIGQGAGSQALILMPLITIYGPLPPDPLAIAMGSAWVLNLAVAEWLIRRHRRPRGVRRPTTTT